MMRRTKQDIENMNAAVKQLLCENNNDPHRAFESLVKTSLMSGVPIPSFIIGIKDFIKVSQESK